MTSERRGTGRGLLAGLLLMMALAAGVGADQGKTYGTGVTLKSAVPVASLLGGPASYVGKTVRVDGVVTKVCQAMGCWLEIADQASARGVRVKAKDGVIVFPRDAAGRTVSAQGVYEEIATSPVREAHGDHAKSAESLGAPAPTSPAEKVYWVRATGAVLH